MKRFILASFLILLLSSCSPRLYQHSDRIQHDTTYIYRDRVDSLYVRDSIFVREKGDTVRIYSEHWRTRIIRSTDTLYRSRTDTLYVDRTEYVDKPLSPFVRWQIAGFWGIILLAIMYIAFRVLRVWAKIKI